MDFKGITLDDKEKIERFVKTDGENSCETAFINLLLWHRLYGVTFFADYASLILKSEYMGFDCYNVPFGDIPHGFDLILENTGGRYPVIRCQQGDRFEAFKKLYADRYDITELDVDEDYVYLREDLAGLRGKKYHAKRNHITAFSKQFAWSFEPVTAENMPQVKACAEKWYKENADRFTEELAAEKAGVSFITENFEKTGMSGGALRVGGEIVAFTFASYVNSKTVDIHIEKALQDFAGAYAVINNQFAARLPESVKYINREDDLGIEGLKKAKLSYHPALLLKKYMCRPKDEA